MKKFVMAVLLVLAASMPAFAEDPLSLRTEGYLVRSEMKDGKQVERLVALPEEVAPGEVINYRITGGNTSMKPLKDIAVVGAVPKGTEYMDKSAETPAGGSVLFSYDDGKNYGKQPLKEKVKGADGKMHEREVPAGRYTNVKFVVGTLGAGKEFSYNYKVQVK